MKKKAILITLAILILCFTLTGCSNKNSVADIKADYFTISYGNSLYDAKDKCDQKTIDSLVEDYNKIEVVGKTNQEINYNTSICIIFIDEEQISGQITIDDKGTISIGDKPDRYIIDTKSDLYINAMKVFDEIKEKYDS